LHFYELNYPKICLPTVENELLTAAIKKSETARFIIKAFVIVCSSLVNITAKIIRRLPLRKLKINF